jgi:hypothetical protein
VFKISFATMTFAGILHICVFANAIGQSKAPPNTAANAPIICSVMEAFEEPKLGVRAIVFHQRDKPDGPRLGELLLSHTGQEMELKFAGNAPYRATVFRVKSAFGRGLALLPASKINLRAGDEFTLRWVGNK